jgi:class 3 adenylate cyclase/tetratricopeptide (TPR) repeat protein
MDGFTVKCPKCQFDNREGVKFCEECGDKFEVECPACKANIPIGRKFCGECGYALSESTEAALPKESEDDTQIPESPSGEAIPTEFAAEGERKHVTVLFSDLTGYTTMSEKLDPEEVKEITSRVFGEISKIVAKYDGFIEKYAGDAVMAIFGVPKAHEDDPIRALKVALEIHEIVDAISPEVENRIGQPISMHTGINTGLVVTGDVDLERGTHGVAGDTVNLASRLSNLAKPGEILMDTDTCRQIEGHFTCEYSETTTVKGKSEPVQAYKVLSQREKPVTIRRLSGVRADLVGRKVELAELSEAVENLHRGKGSIYSVYGDAGTGKSRLVEEFKASLDLAEIQWVEGHAYAYSRNIPYFALIDMLNRLFKIDEGDSSEKVRSKLESGIKELIGDNDDMVPYIGRLYSLDYEKLEEVSPEFWKTQLQEAIQKILTTLAKRAPAIFFLEDLHWADPSFVELLRKTCLEMQQSAIVLCVYRPTFSLFTSHQISSLGKVYHEILLKDLSLSDAQEMLESLLKTESIPSDLKRVVHSKAEGNPFYLEELVNTLIESDTLTRDNGSWKLTRPITESDISSSLHAIISGRLDRLEKETKRLLQEASVIGRVFFYEILKKITALKENIDQSLNGLEQLDLIRCRSLQPELEYMFKHALTQEVVYNGLLKKERKEIHEKIGFIMEQLFRDRLPEFYETLGFHFKQSDSVFKAIDYLRKSGEKSVKRYAVEESHQYYKEAFELLDSKAEKTMDEKELLIELLIEWAYVFYYRGDFKGMGDVFSANRAIAESLEDKSKLGMFYAWFGWAIMCQNRILEGYPWLEKTLQIGKENKDQRVIGYAYTWLTWASLMGGNPEQAIKHGAKAQEIAKIFKTDAYMYFKSLCGVGFAYAFHGDGKKAIEIGNTLVEYGKIHSNIRSLTMGYSIIGGGYSVIGDSAAALKFYEKAINVGAEPFYTEFIRMYLALLYIQNGKIAEAENALNRVVAFSQGLGAGVAGIPAEIFLGVILIAKGQMSPGLKRLKDGAQKLLASGNLLNYLQCEFTLGMVFSQIAIGAEPISASTIFKNIGFLAKNVPFASQKAEGHFKKAIEHAREMDFKSILGRAYFNLGLLHKAKKRTDKATKCLSEAIKVFQQCEAEIFVRQAEEALDSLK